MRKFTFLVGLLCSLCANAQINVSEDFDFEYNAWANPESGIDRFVISTQYFCGGTSAAGALLGTMLGQYGVGPKYMYSPIIYGNNGQDIHINYSVIIGKANATLTALEPVPEDTDWGYFTLSYSLDQGTTWREIQHLKSDNFISTTDCTTYDLVIPSSEIESDTSFMLKYEVNRNANYNEVLISVIDNVSIQQQTLSISDVSKKQVSVYPNPATSVLNINSSEIVKKVEIFNQTGEVVKKINHYNNIKTVEVQDLPKGVYVLKINDGDTQKFIKK